MPLDADTCRLLIKLHGKYGPNTFGKIAQCLLAMTLHQMGWKNIRNHVSEDADIDACLEDSRKYSFEVKTTSSRLINIQQKDIDCLLQRSIDSYQGYFLVLQVGNQAEWYATPYNSSLSVGGIPLTRFRILSNNELTQAINQQYPSIVHNNYDEINARGIRGLLNKMKQLGIESIQR